MTQQNEQQLPPGLANLVANVPPAAAPTPSHVQVMPNPVIQPQAPVQPGQVGAPQQLAIPTQQPQPVPTSAMTPHYQPAAVPVAGQPVVPQAPAQPAPVAPPAAGAVLPENLEVPPPPAFTPNGEIVGTLAGNLEGDPQLAPSISYLEAFSDKLDTVRAFGKAAENRDPRFIDEHYLKEVLGPAQAQHVINVAKGVLTYVDAQTKAVLSQTYAAVGGEAILKQAAGVFNQHADPATKAAIGRLMDSGDAQAMQYAAKQIVAFAQGSGAVVQATGQPLGAAAPALAALSAEQYRLEVSKLPLNASEAEMAALRERRKAGMAQGI
ncbi:capsid assembly scaffolding protein [Pseudomonas phage MYY9]|uniref:Capsid assembly scaffolding protein n=1 Tax=Pseudomonas phage MYY9 TaxID=2798805 RepID=A0A7T7G0H5_9CAUD|nr:capsid assembly scaffolding protein [Pseudomonas phage MYY9]WPH63174.1 capsid assembly scaffolding protein [Pseudomonas phage vB_Pae_PLY]